jgi:hypothetical protein
MAKVHGLRVANAFSSRLEGYAGPERGGDQFAVRQVEPAE